MDSLLQFELLNVKEIIEDALKVVSGKLERKNMKLIVDVPDNLIIEADPARLIQVMVNLLSNAISYSKDETKVMITVNKTAEGTIIVVKDEGIGIERSELPRLFERFYRVDRARSRDSGGTGLGLAIVKHLIEAHGGRVEVDSTIGVGTIFKIHLPFTQKK